MCSSGFPQPCFLALRAAQRAGPPERTYLVDAAWFGVGPRSSPPTRKFRLILLALRAFFLWGRSPPTDTVDVPSRDGHGRHHGRQSCVPSYRMDIWRSIMCLSFIWWLRGGDSNP